MIRSSHLEVFLGKDVLKLCSKFTGEHPCRSVILVKLLCKFKYHRASVILDIAFLITLFNLIIEITEVQNGCLGL